ncbi:hypothetical protein, partial [Treponema pedis]|uniref:hypothetical protein n=1 Tax=Treponema pedis TaxID=409322 RepID=UPI0004649DBA
MKKRQKNQKIEQGVEGNSLIIKNKNDDIEDTFSYKLFEEQYFDTNKIEELINYISYNKLSIREKEILRWMINCVDNCFIYHKDINDYY